MAANPRMARMLYPLWESEYYAAMNEADTEKLTEKISTAGMALFKRSRAPGYISPGERNAMAEATIQLRKLIATKLLNK